MDPKAFEVTLDYRSENSTELLPVEESACYRCRSQRIGEIEPFTPTTRRAAGLTEHPGDTGLRPEPVVTAPEARVVSGRRGKRTRLRKPQHDERIVLPSPTRNERRARLRFETLAGMVIDLRPRPGISGPIFAVLAAAILLVSAPRFVGRQPA
jgi:hypothetical protein